MANKGKALFREFQKQADIIAPKLAGDIRLTEVGGTAAATRILARTLPFYLAQAPKLEAANDERRDKAAALWAPWQVKYRALRAAGMRPGKAREIVAGEMSEAGHDDYSDRILKERLKG